MVILYIDKRYAVGQIGSSSGSDGSGDEVGGVGDGGGDGSGGGGSSFGGGGGGGSVTRILLHRQWSVGPKHQAGNEPHNTEVQVAVSNAYRVISSPPLTPPLYALIHIHKYVTMRIGIKDVRTYRILNV